MYNTYYICHITHVTYHMSHITYNHIHTSHTHITYNHIHTSNTHTSHIHITYTHHIAPNLQSRTATLHTCSTLLWPFYLANINGTMPHLITEDTKSNCQLNKPVRQQGFLLFCHQITAVKFDHTSFISDEHFFACHTK